MAQLYWEDRTDLDKVRTRPGPRPPWRTHRSSPRNQVPSILEYVYSGLEHDISDAPSFEVRIYPI